MSDYANYNCISIMSDYNISVEKILYILCLNRITHESEVKGDVCM